jgi:hypothetical protein
MVPDLNNSSIIVIPSDSQGNIFLEINQDDIIINKLAIGKFGNLTVNQQTLNLISDGNSISE